MTNIQSSVAHYYKYSIILLLLLGLSGCSPIVGQDQPLNSSSLDLVLGKTIGQTFVAEQDGLTGVQVFLSPGKPGDGEVTLHLRNDPHSPDDLAVAGLPVHAIKSAGFYSFTFPAQQSTRQRYAYIFLDIRGRGSVAVGTASSNDYLDGSLYQNQAPAEGQMSFRLMYEPTRAALGLARQAFTWGGILTVAIFLFIMPGWGLLSLVWPAWQRLTWAVKLGLAAGFSLALYPLLLVYTDLIHLHLGPLYAWLPALIGFGIILWRNRLKLFMFKRLDVRAFACTDLILLVILVVIFVIRMWAIRSLEAPMWGDSVQHTMIAQLLYDNGGLFTSWRPYAPYDSLTVQFGFPTAVTIFSWLTGANSLKATLIVGQFLNALAALTIYPLAVRFASGNRWAGIGAVLITGLLSPMPAYYVNWGRYAQLAGQVILPVALWMVWEIIDSHQWVVSIEQSSVGSSQGSLTSGHVSGVGLQLKRKTRVVAAVIAGVTLAGMMLAYYRMPFYYITFILALLVGWGLPQWQRNWHQWLPTLGYLLMIGVTALLLFLPWGLRLTGGNLAGAVESGVSSGSPFERVAADYKIWSTLTNYLPTWLVVFALVGLAWSLVRKRWAIASIGLWVSALASLVATALVHLPGANMMQNFAVVIALYIPAGLLGGWIVGEVASTLETHARTTGRIAIGFLLLGLAAYGGWNLHTIADPYTFAMVTRPDSRAMAWIRDNTPPNALFLVEGFSIWGGASAVGSDAGWWIPLLGQRENTMPPQYALVNEMPSPSNYSQRVVDLVVNLERTSPDSPEGQRLLCTWGITHVYIGQRQGNIGASVSQLFIPEDFTNSSFYSLIYYQDDVYIYELNQQACNP